ncbi:hypothetical protein AOXY_G12872 [Acipenser oxyrinchus oxyrinchus]|uniref:Uncharacterized protein n=1 Tax=Acipenser oxyrinchus oxyrinchus TaxID=40147 RepID=A0AAD8DBR1_ACIOX|nr:hypothetical protein AOXY_G12872 [Acipenser oxyrinchus oxyrinchus]
MCDTQGENCIYIIGFGITLVWGRFSWYILGPLIALDGWTHLYKQRLQAPSMATPTPDLNPVKHVWDELEQCINHHNPLLSTDFETLSRTLWNLCYVVSRL